jgi:hypothetical protein
MQYIFVATSVSRVCHSCTTYLLFSGKEQPALQLMLDLHFEKLSEVVLAPMMEQVGALT